MHLSTTKNIFDKVISEFILNDQRATIYHLPCWIKAISEATGLEGNYLLITEENKITGIVPFLIRKGIFTSLPYTTHCQPLIPENLKFDELIEKIKNLIPDIKGIRFKFRDCDHFGINKFVSNHFNHVIFLGDNIEDYYNSLGRRSIRKYIKKSYENNLELRYGNNENDLKIFYTLECKMRKSIGLPPAPYKFFHCLWKNLQINNNILLPIVEKDSKPIASSMVLKFRDQLNFEYTGIDKRYIDLYPNHFLHWEVIKNAYERFGSRVIDIGRTDKNNNGLIFFKENWNAKRIDLIEYCENIRPKVKKGKIFNLFRWINKHLPQKILQIEGNLLFNKFE